MDVLLSFSPKSSSQAVSPTGKLRYKVVYDPKQYSSENVAGIIFPRVTDTNTADYDKLPLQPYPKPAPVPD